MVILPIYINDLDMWKNIEIDTTEIVYDNKNFHITELEDTRPVFILFYLIVIKYNDPAVKIWPGRVRGNRQSFFFGLIKLLLQLGKFKINWLLQFFILFAIRNVVHL
jgi:hypothetical protein